MVFMIVVVFGTVSWVAVVFLVSVVIFSMVVFVRIFGVSVTSVSASSARPNLIIPSFPLVASSVFVLRFLCAHPPFVFIFLLTFLSF